MWLTYTGKADSFGSNNAFKIRGIKKNKSKSRWISHRRKIRWQNVWRGKIVNFRKIECFRQNQCSQHPKWIALWPIKKIIGLHHQTLKWNRIRIVQPLIIEDDWSRVLKTNLDSLRLVTKR